MADINELLEQRIQELSNPKPKEEKKVKVKSKPTSFDFSKYTSQSEEEPSHVGEAAKALGRAALSIPEFASNVLQAGAGAVGTAAGVPLSENVVRNYLKGGTDEIAMMKQGYTPEQAKDIKEGRLQPLKGTLAPSQEYAEKHPVVSTLESLPESVAPLVYAPLLGPAMPAAFGASTLNKGIAKQEVEHPERSDLSKIGRALPAAAAETALFTAMPGVTKKAAEKLGWEGAGRTLADLDVLGKGTKVGGSVGKSALQRGAIDTPYLFGQGKVIAGLEAATGVNTLDEFTEGFKPENLARELASNFAMGAGFGALHGAKWKKQAQELNTLATHPDATIRQKGIDSITGLLEQKGYTEEAKAFNKNMKDYETAKGFADAYGTELSEINPTELINKDVLSAIELINRPELKDNKNPVSLLDSDTPIKKVINRSLGQETTDISKLTDEINQTKQEVVSPSGNLQALEKVAEGPKLTSKEILPVLSDPAKIKDAVLNEMPIADKATLSPMALHNLVAHLKAGELVEVEGKYYPTQKLADRLEKTQQKVDKVNKAFEAKGVKARVGEEAVTTTTEGKLTRAQKSEINKAKFKAEQEAKKTEKVALPKEEKPVVEKVAKASEPKETVTKPVEKEAKPAKEKKAIVDDLAYEKDETFKALPKAQKKLIREQDRTIRNDVWSKIKEKMSGEVAEPNKKAEIKAKAKETKEAREAAPKKTLEQTKAGKDLRAKADTLSFEDYSKAMQDLYGARYDAKTTLSTWNHANKKSDGTRTPQPKATTRAEKPTNVIATSKSSTDLVSRINSRLKKGFNTVRDKYHYILELERQLGNSLDPENRKTYNELFKIVPELENLFRNAKEIKREGKSISRELKAEKRREESVIGEKAEAPEGYVAALERQAKEAVETERLKKEKIAKTIKDKKLVDVKVIEKEVKQEVKEKKEVPKAKVEPKIEEKEAPVYDREEEIKLQGKIRAAEKRLANLENKGADESLIRQADIELAKLEEQIDSMRMSVQKTEVSSNEPVVTEKLFSSASKTAHRDYERLLDSDLSIGASQSIPKNIKGFVEQIQKHFNLKGKLFITSKSDVDTSELAKIATFQKIKDSEQGYVGMLLTMGNGSRMVVLNDQKIKTSKTLVRTLSHELGHAIINDYYTSASEATKLSINKDMQSWFNKMQRGDNAALEELYQESGKTWTDFKREYASYLNKEGNILAIAGTKRLGLLNEYLAEQVAKYINERHSRPEGAVARFFANVAEQLRNIYNAYRNNSLQNRQPVDSIAKWLDDLTNTKKTAVEAVYEEADFEPKFSNVGEDIKNLYKKGEEKIPKALKADYELAKNRTIEETSAVSEWFKRIFKPYSGASNESLDAAYKIKAVPSKRADQFAIHMGHYIDPKTNKTMNLLEYFAGKSSKQQVEFMDKARRMDEKDVIEGNYEKYDFTKEEIAFLKTSKEYADVIYNELSEILPNLPKREAHFGLALLWDKIPGKLQDTSFAETNFGKKLLGSKGFTKKRSDKTIQEMIAEGGVLATSNPIQTVTNYIREATKFTGVSQVLEDMQVNGTAKYFSASERAKIPQGWEPLNARGTELFSKVITPKGFNAKLPTGEYITNTKGEPKLFSNKKELKSAIEKAGFKMEDAIIERDNQQLFNFAGYSLKEKDGTVIMSAPNKATLEKYWEKHIDSIGEDAKISPKYVPEQSTKAGNLYFPKEFAMMMNNYLSRDSFRANPIGKNLAKMKNFYTKLELGLSGFHYTVINLEAVASYGSLALQRAIMEKRLSAFSNTAKGIAGENSLHAMMKEYIRDPEQFNPSSPKYDKAMNEVIERALGKGVGLGEIKEQFYNAGGLMEADLSLRGSEFSRYQGVSPTLNPSKIKANIKQYTDRLKADGIDLEDGKSKVKVIGSTLGAVMETSTNYLFEHYIPKIKFAFFAKEYAFAIQKQKAAIEAGLVNKNQIARETMSFVEDRFGEMNWENLWLNKSHKSAIQFLMRSATWKLGTAQAMWKGGKNLGQFLYTGTKGIVTGKTDNIVKLNTQGAWLVSIVAVNALMASIIQGLALGEAPKDIKDIVFPRYTERDPEARAVIPTYLKEFVAIGKSIKDDPYHVPMHWIKGGFNGFLTKVYDVAKNKDYFNTQIRDPEENMLQNAIDVGLYVFPKPFSLTTTAKEIESGEGKTKSILRGAMGFTKAPSYINQTSAEQEAFERAQEASGARTKSPEKFEHMRTVSRIAGDVKLGNMNSFEEAIADGTLSKTDIKTIKDKATMHPLVRIVKRLQWADAVKVWKRASEGEKELIKAELLEKYHNALKNSAPEELEKIKQQAMQIFE